MAKSKNVGGIPFRMERIPLKDIPFNVDNHGRFTQGQTVAGVTITGDDLNITGMVADILTVGKIVEPVKVLRRGGKIVCTIAGNRRIGGANRIVNDPLDGVVDIYKQIHPDTKTAIADVEAIRANLEVLDVMVYDDLLTDEQVSDLRYDQRSKPFTRSGLINSIFHDQMNGMGFDGIAAKYVNQLAVYTSNPTRSADYANAKTEQEKAGILRSWLTGILQQEIMICGRYQKLRDMYLAQCLYDDKLTNVKPAFRLNRGNIKELNKALADIGKLDVTIPPDSSPAFQVKLEEMVAKAEAKAEVSGSKPKRTSTDDVTSLLNFCQTAIVRTALNFTLTGQGRAMVVSMDKELNDYSIARENVKKLIDQLEADPDKQAFALAIWAMDATKVAKFIGPSE